ncbi:lipid-A-disaccharide synthase, partial [Deinococcus sp. MIMF12]|nr:lipid-A-disaccharide synthase [Deinococcus rhizophilus]
RELNALGANLPLPSELALARRAHAVYLRDAATARLYAARGVRARWAGSFAVDVLPAPERDLSGWTGGRPVLALLPGSREDHRESLPLMLRAAAGLPEVIPLVAWAHGWEAVTLPPGWTLRAEDDRTAWAEGEGARVALLRGAFGAVARAANVAVGTSGTANEQLAGLGVPVVAFSTRGPAGRGRPDRLGRGRGGQGRPAARRVRGRRAGGERGGRHVGHRQRATGWAGGARGGLFHAGAAVHARLRAA